jgi:16S rRNA G966 N2-methylase RsmD
MDTFEFISGKNKQDAFDIIFIDPPYGTYDLIEIITLLYKNDWASKTTRVYYETNKPININDRFGCYIYKESRAGKVYYGLIRQLDSE